MFEYIFNQGDASCVDNPTDTNLQQPSFADHLAVRDEILKVVETLFITKK